MWPTKMGNHERTFRSPVPTFRYNYYIDMISLFLGVTGFVHVPRLVVLSPYLLATVAYQQVQVCLLRYSLNRYSLYPCSIIMLLVVCTSYEVPEGTDPKKKGCCFCFAPQSSRGKEKRSGFKTIIQTGISSCQTIEGVRCFVCMAIFVGKGPVNPKGLAKGSDPLGSV